MLLSAEHLEKTKRTNVSVNPVITRQRVEELLRPAKIAQKKAIRELAGVSAQVFHSIYSKGNISIKMVIAVSQVLNVSPFYITGESDERGEFSGEALRAAVTLRKKRVQSEGRRSEENKKARKEKRCKETRNVLK